MIERKVGENFRICQKPRSRSSLGKQADPVYQYFHRIEFIGKLAKLLKNIPAVSLDGVGTKINRQINRGRVCLDSGRVLGAGLLGKVHQLVGVLADKPLLVIAGNVMPYLVKVQISICKFLIDDTQTTTIKQQ